MKTVAIIGCGEIGGPVALRLSHAANVIACDLSVARRATLASADLTVTSNVKGCVEAEVLFICVATEAQLEAVVAEIASIQMAAEVVVILSTVSQEAIHDTAKRLISMTVIDAPVSGGSGGAEAGTLTVMAGGDAEMISNLHQLFECFATHVVHCGPLGTGQLTKILNNVLCHTNTLLMAEVSRIGMARGLQLNAMARVMEVSTGRNFLTATPDGIADFYNGFSGQVDRFNGLMNIFSKDLNLANALAEHSEGSFPTISGLATLTKDLQPGTLDTWAVVGSSAEPDICTEK